MIRVSILFLAILSFEFVDSKMTTGRFIASDSFQGFTNPREPVQRLFLEVRDKNSSSKLKLLKVIYFPETTGRRGGAKFLSEDILKYKNVWKLKVHQPTEQKEKFECGRFDNYLRSYDGGIDTDGKEPLLRYRSTQSDAYIRFEKLSEIPCMILDSISR